MVVGDVALWEKTGGRSGTYRRVDPTLDEVTITDGAGGAADAR
jgi:hypothetical protein